MKTDLESKYMPVTDSGCWIWLGYSLPRGSQDVALLPTPFGYIEPRHDLSGYEVFDEPGPRRAAIWNLHGIEVALASAQAREDELRAACDKWSERELLFGAHEDLQARAERAEASAERWRSRYIAEVVCYRMDQHGDTASEALDAANAVAAKLGHLDRARDALSTNPETQTGETT